MKLWTRLLHRKGSPAPAVDENILVISDIHLGEDILLEESDQLAEYIRALNRELAEFVEDRREHPVEGRRWHLVVNGDMFDFVKVVLRPDPEEESRLSVQPQTGRTGERQVPNTSDNVVWKLERIVEIHRPLFKQLALFLLAGNRITFVEGNHDAEFYFEKVRDTLRETFVTLAAAASRQQGGSLRDEEELRGRVAFREWFEASPGRFHIEHGHQYDEYCSFEYLLAPTEEEDSDTLAAPLSHRAASYFTKYAADLTHWGVENAAFWDMARYTLSQGPRAAWELFRGYWAMIFALVGRVGPRRREGWQGLREQHLRRVRALSEESSYGQGTLNALDGLKALPVEYSRFKTFHAAYLDRFLIGAAAIVALVPAFFFSGLLALGWSGSVLVLALGGVLAINLLGRSNRPEELRRAAARIAEITGVRYVVFGHSHQPEFCSLSEAYGVGQFGENVSYLNSGSWVTRDVMSGEQGRGMTYVEITSQGAALKRWRGRNREPVVVAATHPSSDTPIEGAG